MKWLFKKTTVPKTNETQQIDTIQTWRVDWESKGQFMGDAKRQAEFFLSEKEAQDFRDSLEKANALLRNTHFWARMERCK